MSLPAELAKLPVQAPPGVTAIAAENYGLLDRADFVILGVGSPKDGQQLLANALVSRLAITKAGHISFLNFNHANVLLAPNPAVTTTILALVTDALG